MIQQEVQKLAEKRLINLDELLELSDKIAKGEQGAKRDQFNFLKLSIDSTLRMIERFMPVKTEHSGEVFIIKRGEGVSERSQSLQSTSRPEEGNTGQPSV